MDEPLFTWLFYCLQAIGFVLVLTGLLRIKKGLAVDNWRLASGRILVSELRRHWASPEAGGTQYEPKIEYEYEVEGKMYLGTRWTYGRKTRFSKRAAEDILNRYPVGKNVAVFCDRRRPRDAVLERGGVGYGAVLALFGIVLLIPGAIRIYAWMTFHR